jgi:hypothetical protein
VLIGAGLSFVGILIVARFMPARDTETAEDDHRSLRKLEPEGPIVPIYEPSGTGDGD